MAAARPIVAREPLSEIVKCLARFPGQVCRNLPSDEFALLHCNRRYSRQRPALLVLHAGEIADDEYLAMSGNAQVRLDQNPAGTIDRHSQLRGRAAMLKLPQPTAQLQPR